MKCNQRLDQITLMQVLGCIFVIMGHSYPFVTPFPSALLHFRSFIYCFHMPLFVFCSGVLLQVSHSSEKYGFLQFLKRRTMRLLLPYFVFSLLGVIPKILLAPMLNDSFSLDFWELIRAFFVPRENIWGHFWFLPMIFFCGLIGYGFSCLFRKMPWARWIILLVSALGLFLPEISSWFGLDDLLQNLFYFVLGMAFSDCYLNNDKKSFRKSVLQAMAFLSCSVLLFILGEALSISAYFKPLIACGMIAACSAGLLPLSRAITIGKDSLLNRSYSVFILSWPCQLVVELVLERMLQLPYFCIMPCMMIVGLVMPCLLILLIRRLERNMKIKVLSRIIGG